MGILNFLRGESVAMPSRADAVTLSCGVEVIRDLILANRRREAERAQRAEAERQAAAAQRMEGGESGRTINFRISPSSPSQSPFDFDTPTFKPRERRPPNLHAPVLSFSARLLTLVNERCEGRGPVAYKRAGVSRQIYSRIVSDDAASVDKDTALQFCIGLQLTMPEAELLLKAAGYAFSETREVDRAFAWCIEKGIWNIRDVDAILRRSGLPGLKLNF